VDIAEVSEEAAPADEPATVDIAEVSEEAAPADETTEETDDTTEQPGSDLR
jgi:hypothetical protein